MFDLKTKTVNFLWRSFAENWLKIFLNRAISININGIILAQRLITSFCKACFNHFGLLIEDYGALKNCAICYAMSVFLKISVFY